MSSPLSPSQVVLLAVHAACRADIQTLQNLISQQRPVLATELVLRILLTYLPETTPPDSYTELLQKLASEHVPACDGFAGVIDATAVQDLTEAQASRKVRKLGLLELSPPGATTDDKQEIIALFLRKRAIRMDEEAGMLNHVVELLAPFANDTPAIGTWMASTVLPLSRRNFEYYTKGSCSLAAFQDMPDRSAVQYLLSQTGLSEDGYDAIGRDLKGLLSPWLYNSSRWEDAGEIPSQNDMGANSYALKCLGWEQALEWLILQASRSWPVAVRAITQWDGPRDVDFGNHATLELRDDQLQYLDHTYAKAIMASVYTMPESSLESLESAYAMLCKVRLLLGLPTTSPSIQLAADDLPDISDGGVTTPGGSRPLPALLRNELLQPGNPFTEPSQEATDFLTGAVLSAYILTRLGISCAVKKARDLALLRDQREQKAQLVKLIRLASNQAPKSSDQYWIRVRREILWLRSWGSSVPSGDSGPGVFGMISVCDIETDLLKAILSQSNYTLAKSLYEDSSDLPLAKEKVQDAVYHAALDAFDNASNPNRTRGGLRKCNDIIHALPKMAPPSLAPAKQIEALMSAAHSLSGYRLVLKRGEPFRPVVLRVHSDPISIIDKVLEQNPGAYTRLQEFLEIGMNMAVAGSSNGKKQPSATPTPQGQDAAMEEAEKRIVSECILAALREDDFETAYSYVVSRLGDSEQAADAWSWKAAVKAGEYVRTSKTQQPTHLGTSSANPEIRHLEQRLECLATALRVAPAPQLQTILESFRRCEEQLDSAVGEEAAKEAAWDAAGDMRNLPGAFDGPTAGDAYPSRNKTASSAARQAEEAPMSLFDLSRATARVAQRNLTSLSSLHGLAAHGGAQSQAAETVNQEGEQRVRRRDQFREAATGTLVSGVGWLIGANVNRNETGSG